MGVVREGERGKVYEREDGRDGDREGDTVVRRGGFYYYLGFTYS